MTHYYTGHVQQSKLVLIIDDDDDFRTSLAAAFDDSGYVTQTAPNGREALTVLSESPNLPCLIMVDDVMPVMTGAEFVAQQQSDERLRDITVAVIAEQPQLVKLELRRAAARVFKKPLEPDELVRFADTYCG